jgi:HEAT repeat protein
LARVKKPTNESEAQIVINQLFKEYQEALSGSKEREIIFKELEETNKLDVPALILHLNNSNYELRALAAHGLGWANDDRALEPLLFHIEEQEKIVRYFVIKAIGHLKDDQKLAISPLLRALNDKDSGVRIAAIQAVTLYTDDVVLQSLQKIIETDEERVKQVAKSALGYIKRRIYDGKTHLS